MKSKQVERFGDEKEGKYSELKVLRSPAGYYIGTVFTYGPVNRDNLPAGFQEPGSRDSDYFDTEAEAREYLDRLNAGEDLPVRLTP